MIDEVRRAQHLELTEVTAIDHLTKALHDRLVLARIHNPLLSATQRKRTPTNLSRRDRSDCFDQERRGRTPNGSWGALRRVVETAVT
jgi:hypothetical protein